MSAIVNTSFSAGFLQQLPQAASSSASTSAASTNDLRQSTTTRDISSAREIRDTATLSDTSRRLNTSSDSTPTPQSIVIIKDNLAAVKNYIAGHNEEALDQQANQSREHSFALIS